MYKFYIFIALYTVFHPYFRDHQQYLKMPFQLRMYCMKISISTLHVKRFEAIVHSLIPGITYVKHTIEYYKETITVKKSLFSV